MFCFINYRTENHKMGEPKTKRLKLGNVDDQDYNDDQSDNQPKRKIAMIPAEPSIAQQQDDKQSLLRLNDDCLRAIMDKLPLDDLCMMSKTCVRLQELCIDHFQRRHKNKVLVIEQIQDVGVWRVKPKDEKYIDCFSDHIQNVILGKQCANKLALRQLNTFYASDENPTLKEVRFENWNTGPRKNHGSGMSAMFKEVVSATFSNAAIRGDLNDYILKYMPKLKELTLLKKFTEPANGSSDWMNRTYPQLNRFAWHLDKREVPIDRIKAFFIRNPNIRFSLKSISQATIEQLIQEDVRVDELFFKVVGRLSVLDNLLILCVKQPNICLHLEFSFWAQRHLNDNLDKLKALAPYIEGLYFQSGMIDAQLAKMLVTFNKLKVVQADLGIRNAKQLVDIPNLTVLYARSGVSQTNFDSYSKAMLLFAGRSLSLKKIFLRNSSIPFDTFKFKELDSKRRKLLGAKKLKIHFNTQFERQNRELKNIVRDYGSVGIDRVETEIVKNPLVTDLITKIPQSSFYRLFGLFEF